jgi:photosystem II stability/assembly factor-like uncharacterized protein
MNKIWIILSCSLLLAGCQLQEIRPVTPVQSVTNTQTKVPNRQLTNPEGFKLPSTDEVLLFKKNDDNSSWVLTRKGATGKIQVSFTRNKGQNWITTYLPVTQTWEPFVIEKDESGLLHIFPVLTKNKRNWILLTSGPAASMMIKTLYRTDDGGKTWLLMGDITSQVGGFVKGMTFVNPNSGWIGTDYRGTFLVPLYHTKDGGKTWVKQNIPVEAGYRYGNVNAPVFDSEQHGIMEIEFVGDNNKKMVRFETKDGGQNWRNIG